jgi:hypothetical protein
MRGRFVPLVVALAGAASGFTGCDPTEASFAVTLLNDTQRPLIANQCGNGCGSSATEKHALTPGQSVAVNTSRRTLTTGGGSPQQAATQSGAWTSSMATSSRMSSSGYPLCAPARGRYAAAESDNLNGSAIRAALSL